MDENNSFGPIVFGPGTTCEIKADTLNHQYYTLNNNSLSNELYTKVMDNPVPIIGDILSGPLPLKDSSDIIQEHNKKQEEKIERMLSQFEEAMKTPFNFFMETKLLKIYNTQQLIKITEFMQSQFNVIIKNYNDLQQTFLDHNGVIIYKKDLERYKNTFGHVDAIVIELKDCEYVSILRWLNV